MMRISILLWCIFSLPCALTTGLLAQSESPISYALSWDEPHSHFFDVEIRIHHPENDTVLLRIPGWRPGRYVMQNYPKNIIAFEASDETGAPLSHRKVDNLTWQIVNEPVAEIRVRYRYFARELDGGSSYLDDAEAYINPVNLLMYLPGKERRPATLTIAKPADWKIATALEYDSTAAAFVAADYHDLADSPILISPDFDRITFEAKDVTFELVLQGDARYDREKLRDDFRKLALAQMELMKHIPFRRYVFLYHLLPDDHGHGVEHKNSTSIVIGPTDFDSKPFYRRFLGVASHELFHAWNVERLRPAAIYYPDYATEQHTTTMWIYEGFTSYYGGLTLLQAGLLDKEKFFENIAGGIKRLERSYGSKVTSVAMASWDSWSKGYGQAPPNTYVSFYTKGAILGLLLDLDIRHTTENRASLDEALRHLYETYAMKHIGVPEEGWQQAIEEITGKDYDRFFQSYVYGTEELDFETYLAFGGLELTRKTEENKPEIFLGIHTRPEQGFLKIRNVVPETPAFDAGLDFDDLLLAIDGRRVSAANFDRLLKRYVPGDTLRVSVFRREKLRHFELVAQDGGNVKYMIEEMEEPSDLQKDILKSWLNEKR